jgi:ribosomal protein S18 acetylase RimI-like enzyme
LRVDYDFRRQGIGIAMIFQLIAAARQRQARAVFARARANNQPAQQFLAKSGFELAGLDTHFTSNHDLVKETVMLFWYAALE